MITDAIISAIVGGINALFSLMPDFAITGYQDQTGSQIGAYLALINNVLPITTIFTIIGLAILLRVSMSGWDLIVFIYHQFWGSN